MSGTASSAVRLSETRCALLEAELAALVPLTSMFPRDRDGRLVPPPEATWEMRYVLWEADRSCPAFTKLFSRYNQRLWDRDPKLFDTDLELVRVGVGMWKTWGAVT